MQPLSLNIDLVQVFYMVFNALLVIVTSVGVWLLNRLVKTMDAIQENHRDLEKRVNEHKEFIYQNYVTNTALEVCKKDIVGRIDRLERFIENTLDKISQRV